MSTIQGGQLVSVPAPVRECQKGLGAARGVRSRIAGFAQDTTGDVAIMFGLMTFVMMGMIGAAVDLGRWLNARDQTVAAVDAAVLAAANAKRNGSTEAAALAVAQKFYAEGIKSRIVTKTDSIHFTMAEGGTAVTGAGSATIATPFMGILGVTELPLLKTSGAEFSVAKLAVGGNAETNIEISMMLDVSGSMCQPCSKLTDMKDAAKDLVNIVVWADQTKFTSKVAIVPFSADVRPPASMLSAVTPPVSASWPASRTRRANSQNYTYNRTACGAAERTDLTTRYTDAAPGVGKYVMPTYTSNGNCSTPSNGEIVPLSSNKVSLTAKINNLTNGGGTAGHLGTAWAYYMLSPSWSSLLTGTSTPASYTAPKTKKFAILMTDGEYNYTYDSEGWPTSAPAGLGSANGVSSAAQAVAICNNMKLSGIDVYTVGFDLGGDAVATATLNSCASDPTKFYTAATGDQLKQAFRDIALKISSLYLSK